MKKTANKRTPKSQTIQLTAEDTWSTVEAHILAKIMLAIAPAKISISDYDIMCYIPRILPKPGMLLSSASEYSILLQRVGKMTNKDPTVNITVTQVQDPAEANGDDNDDDENDKGGKKTKKGQ